MKFKSIKGTKDILPQESNQWQLLEQLLRGAMHCFNYREIRTPVFEETSLFARSIGELTDIVGKEMYTFIDRSATSITLKPEMTAAVARAYIQHNLGEQQPLTKLYYCSPMFRQERPQAGRLRQFHQYGAEAIGSAAAQVDADVIALSMTIYQQLGVRNTQLRINSVGCEQCRPQYKEQLKEFLRSVYDRLSPESQKRFEQNPLRILDSKDESDQQLTVDAPLMKDYLCEECQLHFDALRKHLTEIGIQFQVDGRIVRGLDYYTKTAFEITCSDLGSQDALAGGGRYDLLIEQLGGKPTPAVGFAAGMERLLMVMEKQQLLSLKAPSPVVFFVGADEQGLRYVMQAVMNLRRQGISCDYDLLGRSVKAQMREADRQQARYVIVVGEEEVKNHTVTLKKMDDRTQESVAMDGLAARLQHERSS